MRQGCRAATSPPGWAKGREVAEALVAGAVHQQEFSAPAGAVLAYAEAVQGEPDRGAGPSMFGQHGGDMGMVMLDGDGRQAEAFGVAGGQEIRVQIVGDGDRLDLQDVQQMA